MAEEDRRDKQSPTTQCPFLKGRLFGRGEKGLSGLVEWANRDPAVMPHANDIYPPALLNS